MVKPKKSAPARLAWSGSGKNAYSAGMSSQTVLLVVEGRFYETTSVLQFSAERHTPGVCDCMPTTRNVSPLLSKA